MQGNNVYLTFDIEVVTSRFSRNLNFDTTVLLPSIHIANELRKRGLNGTFFVSLSPKSDGIDYFEYEEKIAILLDAIKGFTNIDVQPHLHMKNLPLSFETQYDQFSLYNFDQQVEALVFAKEFFKKSNLKVSGFRPGGFFRGERYYEALKEAGYRFSSTMNRSIVDIDLSSKYFGQNNLIFQEDSITEYPVTTVRTKSIKGSYEVLNLSPDFFRLDSISAGLIGLDYLNINFHSFSVFSNRLARENHKGQLRSNLQFLLLDKTIAKACQLLGKELYSKSTIFNSELINWLNFLHDNNVETQFFKDM